MSAVNVLILEDRRFTREVIVNYLSANLVRDASEKKSEHPDRAGGQLSHVLPQNWQPFRPRDIKVCAAEDGEIAALIDAAKRGQMVLREQLSSICVEAFAREPQLPDVLVVDLALSEYEQNELMAKQGHWPAMDCPDCLPGKPTTATDPRDLVEEMTGFKIVKALDMELPIISTSYASHPLVPYCCITHGARAFVRKPVREEEGREGQKGWDWKTAAKYGIPELERRGSQAEDPLAAVILEYLTTLSAHILAALPVLALGRLDGCGNVDATPRVPSLPAG